MLLLCVVVVVVVVVVVLLFLFFLCPPTQIFTSYIRNDAPPAPVPAPKALLQEMRAKGNMLKTAKAVKGPPATGTIPRKKLAPRDKSCKCTGHRPKGQADSSSDIADCLCRDCRCHHKDIFATPIPVVLE